MNENSVYDVKRKDVNESAALRIEYHKAVLSRKIFAKIVDFFLLIVLGLAFFLAARSSIQAMPFYQKRQNYLNQVMTQSGLYVEKEGEKYDIVSYENSLDLSAKQKMTDFQNIITSFIQYAEDTTPGNGGIVQKDFDEYRLNLMDQNQSLFVKDENGEIIENPSFQAKDVYKTYSEVCYVPYIDNHLRGYLLSLFPDYYANTKFLSGIVLWAELPLAVILSSVLVFLVPPLIFRRNRQTIGMFIYHIGLANQELLHVSTGRFLAYSAIWIFGIISLSFLTLGVPLFVSATMLICTKQKQDFPEYMLQLYELDVTNDKIYYSLAEIAQEHSSDKKVLETFQMKKED